MNKRKSNISTTPTQDARPMTAPDAPRRIKIRRIGLAPPKSDARKTLDFGLSPDVAPTPANLGNSATSGGFGPSARECVHYKFRSPFLEICDCDCEARTATSGAGTGTAESATQPVASTAPVNQTEQSSGAPNKPKPTFQFGWPYKGPPTRLNPTVATNYNADFDGGEVTNKPKPILRYAFTSRSPRVLITSTPKASAFSAPTKASSSGSTSSDPLPEANTIPSATYFLRSRRDRLLNGFNDWYNEQTSPFALRKATFCTSVHMTNSLIASCVTAYQLYHSVLSACTKRDAHIEAMVEKIESLANQPKFLTPQFGNPTETSNHRHILHLGAYSRAIEILEAHMKFTTNMLDLPKEVAQ